VTPLELHTLLALVLVLAGTLAMLIGLGLLVVSLRRTGQPIRTPAWLHVDVDQPYYIERLVYRHHRKAGIALISAAALWLWLLSPLEPLRAFLLISWHYLKHVFGSADFPVLAGSCLALWALVIGLLLLLRPSLLKPVESVANRWVGPFAAGAANLRIPVKAHRLAWMLGSIVLLAIGSFFLYLAARLNHS
jgi:hypothetical protein